MNKQQHSPEPFTISNADSIDREMQAMILDANGGLVAVVQYTCDAERIVACVNAMKGIKDPERYRTASDIFAFTEGREKTNEAEILEHLYLEKLERLTGEDRQRLESARSDYVLPKIDGVDTTRQTSIMQPESNQDADA